MFIDKSSLLLDNPAQLNYGIAVTDIDNDGEFELFVAGFSYPNLVLKWMGKGFENIAPPALEDHRRQAIGVAAGDIDTDGQEELYVLNTDTFAGQKRFADRLFDNADDEWVDLFSLPIHQSVLNLTAGRSVACVDRFGEGRYGFFVANYGGPLCLYELDEDGRLYNSAQEARLNKITGGRSVLSLPLVTNRMDIFVGNENGPNFLFRNNGDGTFLDVAEEMRIHDPVENARGIAALDANGDGFFDIVCGNWEGYHRLFLQVPGGPFEEAAPADLRTPTRARTLIAADFDNDGYEEIFFNNIGEPNRLFAQRSSVWCAADIGEALESGGLGTGAAVGDFDGDGRLELMISHGESGLQPLSLYHVVANRNHWLRVLPYTVYGAPARGAVVTIEAEGRTQIRAIDAGSGYLCQMEPVAHFGLGEVTSVERVTVRWLDGTDVTIVAPKIDQVIKVEYPLKKNIRTTKTPADE
jgi:hypothetical protein